MLLEFKIKNYRSFKDEASLSMLANEKDESLPDHSFSVELKDGKKIKLLKSVAFFGVNAGGKSNFLSAFRSMGRIVIDSFKEPRIFELVEPYKLSVKTKDQPCEFLVKMIIDDIIYQYEFSIDKARIIKEKLLYWPMGREAMLFHRFYDKEKKSYEYELGDKLEGDKKTWQNATKETSLFLSTAVTLNALQLKPIFDWFNKKIGFVDMEIDKKGLLGYYSVNLYEKDDDFKQKLKIFLQAADFLIKDIDVTKESPKWDDLPNVVRQEIEEMFEKKEGKKFDPAKLFLPKVTPKVTSVHIDENGQPVSFDFFNEESTGTNVFFRLFGYLYIMLKGRLLVIDELGNSLHPSLVKYILEFIHRFSKKTGQIIFTTHMSGLVDVLRRDQILLVDKNANGASELYALDEFKKSEDRSKSLEKKYLAGVYGATPRLLPVEELNFIKEGEEEQNE